jgi:primosomal protein N''
MSQIILCRMRSSKQVIPVPSEPSNEGQQSKMEHDYYNSCCSKGCEERLARLEKAILVKETECQNLQKQLKALQINTSRFSFSQIKADNKKVRYN